MALKPPWDKVDATTIQHCWRKAGILPDTNPSTLTQPTMPISSLLNADNAQGNPTANAEQDGESALDELESTGALQCANRMNIDALFNPADESQLLDDTSDEEICKAVQDSRKEAEAPIDNDNHDDAPVNACPTRCEVLQAVSVINSYVDTVDSTLARKVEGVLASLSRQMCSDEFRGMTSTHINDYFT